MNCGGVTLTVKHKLQCTAKSITCAHELFYSWDG